MQLSLLDVLPVATQSSATEALQGAVRLARLADEVGYTRLWYAEHHGIPNIASSVPELMIAHVGTQTTRIRLGAGGVMLPNHAPVRVLEQYRTLAALHPDRIDLGIGRAAGTDPTYARALRTFSGDRFPQLMAELLAFAGGGFPSDHPYATLSPTPAGIPLPPVWILGSSGGTAQLAGQIGAGYAFAGHFSPAPAWPAVDDYRRAFRPSASFSEPRVILALSVICADSPQEAVELSSTMEMIFFDLARGRLGLALSPAEARAAGWRPGMSAAAGPMARRMVVGDPTQVRARIEELAQEAEADEVMIMSVTHDPEARLRSHALVAEAFGLGSTHTGS